MYDVAEPVLAWRDAGRRVLLARLLRIHGMSSGSPAEAAAFSAADRVGSLVAGAADAAVGAAASRLLADGSAGGPVPAERLTVAVGDAAARSAGLSCGGRLEILLQPAEAVPDAVWNRLRRREPVVLATDLDDPAAGTVEVGTAATAALREAAATLAAGHSDARVAEVTGRHWLLAGYQPVTRLVVVGEGLIAEALRRQADLLGWELLVVAEPAPAAAEVGRIGPADAAVVLSHDPAVDTPVLAEGLAGAVGYLGALGSRRTQQARADRLLAGGADPADLRRVHGPAGLDLGSTTPAEIAVAVVAEVLAVRAGRPGGPLRDRPGPVHAR